MLVGAAAGHLDRNAVGRIDHPGRGTTLGGKLVYGRLDPRGHRLDEARVVVEKAELVHLRGIRADRLPSLGDVFQILPAARIGAERRGDERQGVTDAVVGHRAQRVGQQGVPIPIAPIDRQAAAVRS